MGRTSNITRALASVAVVIGLTGGPFGHASAEASNQCTSNDDLRVVDGVAYACFGPARRLRWARLDAGRPVVDSSVTERPAGRVVGSGVFDVSGNRRTGPGDSTGIRCGYKNPGGWNVVAWFEYSSGELVVAPMGRSDDEAIRDYLSGFDKDFGLRRNTDPYATDPYNIPWGWSYVNRPGVYGICRFFPAMADAVVDNGFFTVAGMKYDLNREYKTSSVKAGQKLGVAQVQMNPDDNPISGGSDEWFPCTTGPSNATWPSDGSVKLWWRYASGLERTLILVPQQGGKLWIDSDGLKQWSNNTLFVQAEPNPDGAGHICYLMQIKLK